MRRRLLAAAGPVFIGAGVLHFLIPRTYERIMPPWLPAHRELVYASGVAEAIGGAALLHPNPQIRRFGGWFEAATMIGVLPANVHMALNAESFGQIPKPALWGRLPLQAGFVAWALASARR